MKIISLLSLSLLGLLFQNAKSYRKVEIYQESWQLETERPLTAAHVLRLAEDYELLETQAAIDSLAALLANKPDTGPNELRDMRLVGLFHHTTGTDTLLIDSQYNCFFRDKHFKLDSALAQALTIKDLINPAFHRSLVQNRSLCVCHARPESVVTASIRPEPTEQIPQPKKRASYLLVEAADATTRRSLPHGAAVLLQAPASKRATRLRLYGRAKIDKIIGPVGVYTIKLVAPCYDTLTIATNFSLEKQHFYRLSATMRCSRR